MLLSTIRPYNTDACRDLATNLATRLKTRIEIRTEKFSNMHNSLGLLMSQKINVSIIFCYLKLFVFMVYCLILDFDM
jgi:hypothetical protein